MRGGLWLLLAGCAGDGDDTGDLLPDGPVWTGAAAARTGVALAVGDLDGDGRAELVVQSEQPGTTSFVEGYTPSGETSQIMTVTADAIVRVAGAQFDDPAPPAILADVTGDGLGELVFGALLYSGLPAAGASPALVGPELPSGTRMLYEPCVIEEIAGFCDGLGFWSPEGPAITFDPPWDPPGAPASDGWDLWIMERDSAPHVRQVHLTSLTPTTLDPRALPATDWEPFSETVSRLVPLRVDLLGGGSASVLLFTAEDLHVTGADAVTLDGPSVHLGDVEPIVFTTGDFDGDGQPDLALRAVDDVRVFRGPLVGALSLDDADRVFRSDAVDTDFGHALAAGDLDGDGRDDLVIGEPSWSDGAGRVHVAWGGGL